MCGLVEHRTALPDPICGPRNHFLGADGWSSKQRARLCDIAKQCAGTFNTRFKHGLNAKVQAKIECNFPYGKRFFSSDIQKERWRLTIGERTQTQGVCISLPDH